MRYAKKMVRETTSLKHIRVVGSGSQVIVLLHGFMSSKEYWRRVITRLDLQQYTAVSIDLLGFGKAPKPDAAYTYNDHVRHVRSVIEHLGLQNNSLVIAGHSMGALIASRYANAYPDNVRAVGLFNPPIYIDSTQAKATLLSTGLHYRFLLTSQRRELIWAAGRSIRVFPEHSPASRERSLQSVVIAAEFLEDVAHLSVRTLLTIGEKDRWLYQDNIRLADNLGANFHIKIDKTGHHAAITHPALVAGYLQELIG